MLMIHAWKEFVETHDYERLLCIYQNFMSVDYSEYGYIEAYLRAIGYLSTAIFERKHRRSNFDKAEDWALNIVEPTQFSFAPSSYCKQSLRSSSAIYHLIRIFRYLLDADNSTIQTALRKAFLESKALASMLVAYDPLNTFCLKTEVIYHLLQGNLHEAKTICQKLEEYALRSSKINQFIQKVKKWCDQSKKWKGRRFLIGSRIDIDEYDPHERVLKHIVTSEMIKDVEDNLIGADAVIFVEGICDARILQEFAKKVIPHRKVIFMDVEGFTNMYYYSEAKIAKELKVPIFLIFDGDTSRIASKKKIRERLIRQITIPENHILTMKKNSIEDYLLVPEAIKRAFPSIPKSKEEIKEFLDERKNKLNKKVVLDTLFKRAGIGKYDHEKAARIAFAMKSSEIDPDIVRILRTIDMNI